ncbi:MAG: Hsp20/alpha crystallin family protein [Desulfobacterales bacterium]|jgi:HSP20 family molecular chaperone IbpA|nr:Hsp20/alpha crystallin family protein [Desulfobacterales bacterium]
MTTDTKELQAKEKQELASVAEQTKPGLVFTPDVDIYETDHALKLVADMPGVTPETLNIDLRDNVLTITGDSPPLGGAEEKAVLVEYNTGTYYRQFTLSEIINQDKIDAQLNDGVLSLTLPKVEKAAPRKIAVTAQ